MTKISTSKHLTSQRDSTSAWSLKKHIKIIFQTIFLLSFILISIFISFFNRQFSSSTINFFPDKIFQLFLLCIPQKDLTCKYSATLFFNDSCFWNYEQKSSIKIFFLVVNKLKNRLSKTLINCLSISSNRGETKLTLHTFLNLLYISWTLYYMHFFSGAWSKIISAYLP